MTKSTVSPSKTWRSPAFGVAAPGATVEVAVEKPLDLDNDVPLLISWPRSAGLLLDEIGPKIIKVKNPTGRPVPFALLFTRRAVVAAAAIDWKELFTQLARMRRSRN